MEGRGKRNTESTKGKMDRKPGLATVSTKQRRIAELAQQIKGEALTSLSHHMDEAWMGEAHRRTRKSGAVGVDGTTARQYEENLTENLQSLLRRAKAGDTYRAPPVRRVYIPKAGGRGQRPIGIPTFEDKVLQRAVVMVLEPIYEQEFYDCSYGFRPGRGAHDALSALREGLMQMHGGWILEIDIKSFFDDVDHGKLRELLRQRVNDGVLTRLIGKWMKAGVMEGGSVRHPETGTPQGGVISPLLANIYLHEALDKWFEQEVKPRLGGEAFMVRFADDATMVFKEEGDARRVMDVLAKRLARFGLTLNAEKTRLVRFERPPKGKNDRPETFDLLGFTHYWAKSQKGNWVIKRKTASSRMRQGLARMKEWISRHRHLKLSVQHAALSAKLRGHYGYFGITGNSQALWRYQTWVERMWQKWLGRRGGRHHNWEKMQRIFGRYRLPDPRIHHAI